MSKSLNGQVQIDVLLKILAVHVRIVIGNSLLWDPLEGLQRGKLFGNDTLLTCCQLAAACRVRRALLFFS